MKRIIINFSKLKKGGGQNVALNFLYGVGFYKRADLVFFVAKDSEAHKYLQRVGSWDYYVFPNNPIFCGLYELWFSLFNLRKINANVIYTYFGYSFFLFADVPQVTGAADSNLFFPEVDFWKGEAPFRRFIKAFIDKYRVLGLKNSSAVIFENPELLARAQCLYGVRYASYIKPSIVKHVEGDGGAEFFRLRKSGAINLLLLCGWQRNKGILIIPYLLRLARERNINLNVILTAGEANCSVGYEFVAQLKKFNIADCVKIVAPVRKADLASVYNSVDMVLLLSKLESFSNNIIESWTYKVPLVVADEFWAKAICKEAAVYVDRDSPQDILEKISLLHSDQVYRDSIVDFGCDELTSYPSIEERIDQELGYVLTFSK
ncbi:MAG: glycosyltransferase [Pseudomonas sp.]|nr:glycosyltransferase [Pseudomonas sp.]